jgi:two-component system sensor histidine kinase TctE
MADLRDIDIELNTVNETLIVRGDGILLQSALLNLLDNAIKYAPPDTSVIVDVFTAAGRGYISVRDFGEGFPKTDMKRLTKRFVRGTNTAEVVGSGLGLTIADEVARAHGGQLILRNAEEGTGACAILSLSLS